jgi:hypothetical protein
MAAHRSKGKKERRTSKMHGTNRAGLWVEGGHRENPGEQ